MQSATGFGFALIAAPALTAAFGPRASVSALTVAGLSVSILTLGAERRPLEVLRRRAAVLVGASIPGMALGALVLRHAPLDALRVLVALAVLGAVVVTARARPHAARGDGWGSAGSLGAVSGALSTSTGINGPPLVLHLLHRGASPQATRDTLAAIFLVSGVLTLGILGLSGTFRPPGGAAWLVVAAVAGQFAGRRAFRLLRPRYRAVTLGVLALSAAVALVPAAQALL